MKRVPFLLLIVLCVFIAGCGPSAGGSYTVTGRITKADDPGQGLEGVTIAFSGGYGTATTDASGNWSKSGLADTVIVTPAKEGWAFDPTCMQVTRAATSADFVAILDPIPIEFEDPALESAVRKAIGKTTGQLISTDVMHLGQLDAPQRKISRLGGVEYLVNLRHLYLSRNQVSDISPLAGLSKLTDLDLRWNQVSDISALGESTRIRTLDLRWNEISDLSALAGLSELLYLFMECNRVSDISALAGSTDMQWLSLTDNLVCDISALKGLTCLQYIWLDSNLIDDISALVENSYLGNGVYVDLRHNRLDLSTDSDDMQNINALIARGVTVHYDPQGPAPSSAIH